MKKFVKNLIKKLKTLSIFGSFTIPKNRITPEFVKKLNTNEIFVFGSNLDGKHTGGAAAFAARHFGAQQNRGKGLTGQCYALPTVGHNYSKMSNDSIEWHIDEFIENASMFPSYRFLVTEVACGIAGRSPEDIAPYFKNALYLDNVTLPKRFLDVLI